MSQSLVNNCLHIIFSTKYRRKLIAPSIENELYAYIGGICKRLDCQPIKVGGYDDHVHILCTLSKKIALMKLLEEVKSHSSKWAKGLDESMEYFYWQDGYGAFSVNSGEVDRLVRYIANQRNHHSLVGFQDEYRYHLHKHRVDYNEKYVWD